MTCITLLIQQDCGLCLNTLHWVVQLLQPASSGPCKQVLHLLELLDNGVKLHFLTTSISGDCLDEIVLRQCHSAL